MLTGYLNETIHPDGTDIYSVNISFNNDEYNIYSRISICRGKVVSIVDDKLNYSTSSVSSDTVAYNFLNTVFDNLSDAERLVGRIVVVRNKLGEFNNYKKFLIDEKISKILMNLYSETNPEWVV